MDLPIIVTEFTIQAFVYNHQNGAAHGRENLGRNVCGDLILLVKYTV